MALRHRRAPACPSSLIPACFAGDQAKQIETYLQHLLLLEPWPRSNALRQFLAIAMPPPPAGSCQEDPVTAGRQRLPVGTVAIVLGFCDARQVVRRCSQVCRSFRAASLHPRCWPTLRVRSRCAERCIDGLCSILLSASAGLQVLTLDLTFQHRNLGVALPAELVLKQLQRLTLRLGDAESAAFACDLLGCVESPGLREMRISAQLTPALLHAVSMTALSAEGGLFSLALKSISERVRLETATLTALQELLEVAPGLQNLSISIEDPRSGASRAFAEPVPVLANLTAFRQLQSLNFDFLSDDVLAALVQVDDRTWNLRTAFFSGCKEVMEDPGQALATLLTKLSPDLEEFTLLVDLELMLRDFAQSFHQRLGPLPNLWQGREKLRRLELNWHAFDDDGVGCLVDCCPQLESLVLDRAEYWTDDAVQRIVLGLHSLRHLRVRASPMMSDRALQELQQAQQLQLLELEPSYSMSSYMLDQLKGPGLGLGLGIWAAPWAALLPVVQGQVGRSLPISRVM
ncbi:unnamed protein product [Effrenium voratum]|nr:unnamed protein product [Effrenium voratum]